MLESCGIDFVQEVYATRVAANTFIENTDVIIELGGEDAKILFLSGGMEVRMRLLCWRYRCFYRPNGNAIKCSYGRAQ